MRSLFTSRNHRHKDISDFLPFVVISSRWLWLSHKYLVITDIYP